MKVIEFAKTKTFRNWMIVIIVVLLIGLPFLKFHLTTDGYSHLMLEYIKDTSVLLSHTGRPLSDFVILYFNILDFGIIEHQTFFNFFSIVLTLISMYVFYKEINKVTNNKITSQLLLLFSILFIYFNAFSYELYLFSVMFSITIQYLLITFSLKFLTEKISLNNIIYSIILNGLGACFYQGTVVLYLPLALLIVGYIHRKSNIKTYIIENIKVFLIFGFSILSNFAYMKLLPFPNRYDVDLSFKDRVLNLLSAQGQIWKISYNIFIKYFFFLTVLVLLIVSIIIIIKNKNKKKFNEILTLGIILATTIGASYASVFVSGISVVPRAIATISSLPGILLLFILMFRKEVLNKSLNMNLILNLIVITFSICLVEASSSMIGHLIKTNEIDKNEISKIHSIISKENVKYISFAPDQQITYTYNQRYYNLESFVRSSITSWSRLNAINYYLKTDYEEVEATPEFINYCLSNNWNEFKEEEIIIQNGIAYICVY